MKIDELATDLKVGKISDKIFILWAGQHATVGGESYTARRDASLEALASWLGEPAEDHRATDAANEASLFQQRSPEGPPFSGAFTYR